MTVSLDQPPLASSATTDLTVVALAAQGDAALASLRAALFGAMHWQDQIAQRRASLDATEAQITASPEIDGKNAETRKAQVEAKLATLDHYQDDQRALWTAQRELAANQAQAELARESLRFVRSLLAAVSGGERP